MYTENFDFSYNMEGLNRDALLKEAADRIDNLQSHLSSDVSVLGATKEGNLVRDLLGDEAHLVAFPDVYKITDKSFLTNDFKVPVRFSQLSKDFNFYWIRLPLGLVTKRSWAFNMIEMGIEFNKEDDAHLRPKAFRIFPDMLFQKLFEFNQEIRIGIDGNFEFEAKGSNIEAQLGNVEGKINAGVGANASAKLGFAFGPYVCTVKKATIYHTAKGMERVFWRLDGAELFEEDSPELVVVAQIPKKTKTFLIEAKLQAYHSFKFATSNLRQLVSNLPQGLRAYIQGGIPTKPDEKVWDVTGCL